MGGLRRLLESRTTVRWSSGETLFQIELIVRVVYLVFRWSVMGDTSHTTW